MRGRRRTSTIRAGIRLAIVVLFLAPVVILLAGSFRRLGLPPPDGLALVPTDPSLDAFRALPDEIDVMTAVRNSTIVVAIAVPIGVLVASAAGFALSQLRPAAQRRWLLALLALLVVPLPMLWVARFVFFLKIGVLDTLTPLIAPAIAGSTPVAILLAWHAFRRLPTEQWEAARLEGVGAVRTWYRFGLPQVRATTTAVAVLVFVVHWGAYLDALLYVRSREQRTLPLAVAELRNLDPTDTPIALAGALLLVVPPLVLLLGTHRRWLAATVGPTPRNGA